MVRMAARYGHFRLNELRGAMESNSSATIEGESLVTSPVSEVASAGARANQLKGLAPEVGLEPTTLRLTGQS